MQWGESVALGAAAVVIGSVVAGPAVGLIAGGITFAVVSKSFPKTSPLDEETAKKLQSLIYLPGVTKKKGRWGRRS